MTETPKLTRREFLRTAGLTGAAATLSSLRGDSVLPPPDLFKSVEGSEQVKDATKMAVAQIEKDGTTHDVPAVVINAKKMGLIDTPNPLLIVSIASPQEATTIGTVTLSTTEALMAQRHPQLKNDTLASDEIILPITDNPDLADLGKGWGVSILTPTGRVKEIKPDDYLSVYAASGAKRIVLDKHGYWGVQRDAEYQVRTAKIERIADFVHQNQPKEQRESDYTQKEFVTIQDIRGPVGVDVDLENFGYPKPFAVTKVVGRNFPGLAEEITQQGEYFYLSGKRKEDYFGGANFSAQIAFLQVPDREISPGYRTYMVVHTDNATYQSNPNTSREPQFDPNEAVFEVAEQSPAHDDKIIRIELNEEDTQKWKAKEGGGCFVIALEDARLREALKTGTGPKNIVFDEQHLQHAGKIREMTLTLKDKNGQELKFSIERNNAFGLAPKSQFTV